MKPSESLKYVETSGNGYDLPSGCVVELFRMFGGPFLVERPKLMYWNPNGIAISNDPKFRTVCYNPHKAMEGIYFLTFVVSKVVNLKLMH